MSRRIFRTLSALGLSIFILFMLASIPVSAKSNNTTTPLTVNTNVICYPSTFFTSNGWQETGNGPASSGCGGHAWETTTPTQNFVQYNLGVVSGSGSTTYNLRAFITGDATAPMNYDIYAATNGTLIKSCFFNQNTAIAWANICKFTVNASNGQALTIIEWSGAVHTYTMSASAIQI
jgi:hypothetical protein